MNSQPIKRRNPFEVPKNQTEEVSVVENEKTNDFLEDTTEYVEEKPVVRQQVRQQPVQRQPKVVQRQQYYQPEDVNREKYTSTMDVALRRQIKIACATRGIMFAKFVEDACREKLAKEGFR